MYKIFKYDVDPLTRSAMMPKGIPLRADYVDDGFYKGHYAWSIVDENDSAKFMHAFPDVKWSACPAPQPSDKVIIRDLKVKEKQDIYIEGDPIYAQEADGTMQIHARYTGKLTHHKIAVYKTGQAIDLPIEKLTYLGLNRLWIIQELGLYTFLVNE